MPLLKAARATQLNKSHPLSRDLVGCWLLNEGTGGKIFDLSGYGSQGTLQGNTFWATSKFGFGLKFDGDADYVDVGNNASLKGINSSQNWSISLWMCPLDVSADSDNFFLVKEGSWGFTIAPWSTPGQIVFTEQNTWYSAYSPAGILAVNNWYHLVFVGMGDLTKISLYVNGAKTIFTGQDSRVYYGSAGNLQIGGRTGRGWFEGSLDKVMIFNRALSAVEITLLYREPFCMFEPVKKTGLLFVPQGQFVNLAGILTAQSNATAAVKLIKRISGTLSAAAEASAVLKIIGEVLLAGAIDAAAISSGKLTLSYRGPWLKSLLKTERHWLTDTLFNGMTSNAFKLGTILTGGWFWMRPSGCTVLYRGPGMEQIDFANILAVIEQNAESMPLPRYIPHNSDSIYFYVVRRFNSFGHQETTLQAAAKVSLAADGNLKEPQPNSIFAWWLGQVDGNKVQLVWFYCSLEQKSQPMRFKVYYDGGTGQIDYANPIAEIVYRGRKFYSYRSDTLAAGRYLFVIKSEDTSGVQDNSLTQMAIEIVSDEPNSVEILKVKTI
jgi:hypothetical protein